jgi:NTP pyrophosphatase (non-canonical NTP hydrolase)
MTVQPSLDGYAREIHANAVQKGFWPEVVDDIFIAKQCMMIVSEVTELMEAIRKDRGKDETARETADILIRTLDLWQGMLDNGYVEGSLQATFNNKTENNKSRPERHGVRF